MTIFYEICPQLCEICSHISNYNCKMLEVAVIFRTFETLSAAYAWKQPNFRMFGGFVHRTPCEFFIFLIFNVLVCVHIFEFQTIKCHKRKYNLGSKPSELPDIVFLLFLFACKESLARTCESTRTISYRLFISSRCCTGRNCR